MAVCHVRARTAVQYGRLAACGKCYGQGARSSDGHGDFGRKYYVVVDDGHAWPAHKRLDSLVAWGRDISH